MYMNLKYILYVNYAYKIQSAYHMNASCNTIYSKFEVNVNYLSITSLCKDNYYICIHNMQDITHIITCDKRLNNHIMLDNGTVK